MPNRPNKKKVKAKRKQWHKRKRDGGAAVCAGGSGKETTCEVCLRRAGRTKQRVEDHEPDTRTKREKREFMRSFRQHRPGRRDRDADAPYLPAHHLTSPLANHEQPNTLGDLFRSRYGFDPSKQQLGAMVYYGKK